MRLLLTLAIILSFAISGTAQIRQVYLPDNAVLRTHHDRQEWNRQQELAALFGLKPESLEKTVNNDCPPELFGTYIVLAGDTLRVEVDTVALGGGDGSFLELLDCEPIDFGSVFLDTTTLTFIANPGVAAGIDTICVEFCDAEENCQTFIYPFLVKRPSVTYVTQEIQLQAEAFLPEFCLNETVLPGELYCNKFIECADDYDGEGRQLFRWTTYDEPTSCLSYQASRFAGIDTVCAVLCDEFTVCDTFKVPFRIISDTLALPFFDDFSYDGPYPSRDYWLDKDAYVNNTMSPNPPSVGLATFDGLNAAGRPYTSFGDADHLTSKYIDLSNPQGDVYLKFFISPKGWGNLPNEVDSLELQFRNNQGQWNTVASYNGFEDDIPADSLPPFDLKRVQILNSQYFYKGFQFRFINHVSPVGIYDLWHIDYIWLDENEGPGETFDDVALTMVPPPILKNYSSMPWRHFEPFVFEEFNTNPLPSGFYNHTNEIAVITESSIKVRERTTNTNFPGSDNLVNAQDANIPVKEPTIREVNLTPGTQGDYISILQASFPGAEYLEVEMEYQLTFTGQQTEFFRNDTTRTVTIFDEHFAHDDGSAESFIFLENPNNENPIMAVGFHANVEDTLRAVQFHFPHLNSEIESQLFNLLVWTGDLDSEPVYERVFLQPLFTDSKFDTLQGFTTYRLNNILGELTPVYLPAGTDFYIGLQQITTTNDGIPVGFDFNIDHSDRIFFNLFGNWIPFPENFRPGSLMMRAVVGDETPSGTSTKEIIVNPVRQIRVFPNPATHQITLEVPADVQGRLNYQLFNTMGQLVRQGMTEENQVDLHNVPSGLYVIRVIDQATGQAFQSKVVVTH